MYQAIPVPQINITILKGQAQRPAEGTFPWGAEGALPCPDRRAGQKMELERRRGRGRWLPWGTEQKHVVIWGGGRNSISEALVPFQEERLGTGPREKEPQGRSGSHPSCIGTESLRVTVLRAAHHLAQPGTAKLGSQAARVLHPRGPVSAVHLLRESHGPDCCSCCFWINALHCRDFPEGTKKNF